MASESETYLLECFENMEKSYKSCLHLIAAIRDTEKATELCRQLLERISNRKNREYLLNMTTVYESVAKNKIVRARVAAIHIAAYNGNSGIVRLLCQEYGVDVNCSTSETLEEEPKKGITALEWAARRGHTEVVKALIDSEADVNVSRHTNGVAPLYIAAQEGHIEVVQLLADNNADVNASRHTDGTTPLYIAVQNGHTEVVKVLLDNQAEVNAIRHDGATPLLVASIRQPEVAKLLLDYNADVNTTAHCGGMFDRCTPLYLAALFGHTDLVKLLLNCKADVNARITDDGKTPLYIAAKKGHRKIVKLLLDNNADVNLETHLGERPVHAARKNHHLDTVELLK